MAGGKFRTCIGSGGAWIKFTLIDRSHSPGMKIAAGKAERRPMLTFDEIAHFYDSVREKALRVVCRFGFDRSDAEDIVQDAILEAFFEGENGYNPSKDGGTMSWVLTMVSCRAKDQLRTRARRTRLNEKIICNQPRISDPEAEGLAFTQQKNRAILAEMLPAQERRLYDLLGSQYAPRQIAKILDVSIEEVRRLQQKLRRTIVRNAALKGFTAGDLFSSSGGKPRERRGPIKRYIPPGNSVNIRYPILTPELEC